MADDAKLRILIEAILDEKGIKQAENALKGVGKEGVKTGELVKTAGRDMTGFMDKAVGFISNMGIVAVAVGGAMTPIIKAAQSYVNTAQMANAGSREWLATTYQIEQAQLKVGKAAMDFLLPTYSKIGDLVEKWGNFAESNPAGALLGVGLAGAGGAIGITEIVGFVLKKMLPGLAGAGGTAAGVSATSGVVSGAASAAGGAGMTVASMFPESVLAPAAAGTAAVGGAAIAGTATAVSAIALIGAAEVANYKSTMGVVEANEEQGNVIKRSNNIWERFSDYITTLYNPSYPLTQYVTPEEAAARDAENKQAEEDNSGMSWWEKFWSQFKKSPIVGGTPTTTQDILPASVKSEFKTTELIKAQYEFRKQETYAQEDFHRQWKYSVADFNRNRLYQEEDFNRQRAISYRSFAMQQAQSEKMFYLQRAIAQRDYQISVSRNDYDYQLSRKRAQEDHNFSLKQIMLSGDALAYYYSERQFKIDKQRAEEDYQLQKRRAAEDFARSQGDSLMFFNIERAFSRKMFDIQMQDQEIQYQITRDRAKWEFENVTLKRMDEEYKIQANRRLKGFYDQIAPMFLLENDLRLKYENSFLDTSIQGYISAATAMQNYFNQLIENYRLPNDQNMYPGVPNRQAGGYTSNQAYMLHDHEFVLSPSTTRHAEQVAQGALSQDKIISMLSGGGGLVYNDSRQFSRGLSIDEKTMLRQELRQMVVEAFR